jgi:small redox-active disulfide protein 2
VVIKVLGTGCPNCRTLKSRAREVVDELGLDAEIVEVTDMRDIAAYGVMQTPGLVIDERVVGYGGVPDKPQLNQLIIDAAARADAG